MTIICLHYNLEGPGSNLKLSAPQEHSRTQMIRRAGLRPLSIFSFHSGSVLHLKQSHRYAHRHSCPNSSWPLLAPTGAHSNSTQCPQEDRRVKGAMQALSELKSIWVENSGLWNSECGPEGEGVTPSSSRPLTHWGSRTFKIWPGLRFT